MDDWKRPSTSHSQHSLREEEARAARRRNDKEFQQEELRSVADYFRACDSRLSKYSQWTSDEYYSTCSAAQRQVEEQAAKEKSLNKRRQALITRLQQDIVEQKDIVEKKCHQPAEELSLEQLRNMNLEMKRRREEIEIRRAELLKHQAWKQSQPQIRELERKQHMSFIVKSWNDQLKEKERKREEQMRQMEEIKQKMELERKLSDEREMMILMKKKEQMYTLRKELENQMEAIKMKDEKTKELKLQEREEMKLKMKLDEAVMLRNIMEENRKKIEIMEFNRHQYRIRLKQKARAVLEEIEADKRILEGLENKFREREESEGKARESAIKDIQKAVEQMKKYKEQLKEIETEFDFIFYEEAKRLWLKQEEKWLQEQHARNNLMRDVLDTLSMQIQEKLSLNIAEQEDVQKSKEALIREAESINWQLKEEEDHLFAQKEKQRKELDLQILEKQLIKEEELRKDADIVKAIKDREWEEQKKLCSELTKMHDAESMMFSPRRFL